MEQEWYEIDNIDQIDSPALVVYEDRVRKNIDTTIQMIGDVNRLRPHVKTHKSSDVTRMLLGAGITKFKCATIAEADMLGACGAPDVLLAYQPVGPKIDRFLRLMEKYPNTEFSCLTDNSVTAVRLAKKATDHKALITVYIDLNVGMDRSGIVPGDDARRLVDTIRALPGLHFAGLHAYDGHISMADMAERGRECDLSFAPVEKLAVDLKSEGIDVTIVAGGSPTFPIHARRENVECSPGTFVFWDKGYQEKYPEQALLPAALVITRVISKIKKDLYCLDLGHKSIAPENPLERRVHFYNVPEVAFVSQSEEHLVVKIPSVWSLEVGDILYGVPIHICPTVALYEDLKVIKDHKYTSHWPVEARDRKINV